MKYAEKVTYGWQDAGHKQTFAGFYLSDYALSEPYRSLTKKEFNRLKELQKKAREEVEREQAKYNFSNYEGRPMGMLTKIYTQAYICINIHKSVYLYNLKVLNFWGFFGDLATFVI